MLYGVYISDFIQKKNMLIKTFNSKENALEFLQDYSNKFLIDKQGDSCKENLKLLREPSSINSLSFGNYPYGYLICYSKESFYKNVIYHKKLLHGLIRNSYSVEKIFSIDILEINQEKKIKENNCLTVDKEIEKFYSQKVIPELLSVLKGNILSNSNI